jgi:hypothetical protein
MLSYRTDILLFPSRPSQTPTRCIQSGDIYTSASTLFDSLSQLNHGLFLFASALASICNSQSFVSACACARLARRRGVSARVRWESDVPIASYNLCKPCSSFVSYFFDASRRSCALSVASHRLLEEITAHCPLASIPLQAPDTLICCLLTGVEILAVCFAIAELAFARRVTIQRTTVGNLRCRRTCRTWWRSGPTSRAYRSRRACLSALCR